MHGKGPTCYDWGNNVKAANTFYIRDEKYDYVQKAQFCTFASLLCF